MKLRVAVGFVPLLTLLIFLTRSFLAKHNQTSYFSLSLIALVSIQAFHLRKEEGENEFKGFDKGRGFKEEALIFII